MEVSQKEYTEHIERLHFELQEAWASDERVHALKLAIQCAKLLGEPSLPEFYPAMFVLTTEVLDTFGRLVYERIRCKAHDEVRGVGLHERRSFNKSCVVKKLFALSDASWTSSAVCADAKETCRNWFYKTACIRELLPRFYVEVALLRCYRFLSDGELPSILARLGSVARGIGDPLVALYARCYLARAGGDVAPRHAAYCVTIFHDYLFCFQEIRTLKFQTHLRKLHLTEQQYLRLTEPAVQWLLECLHRARATLEDYESVLAHYRDYCNDASVLKVESSVLKKHQLHTRLRDSIFKEVWWRYIYSKSGSSSRSSPSDAMTPIILALEYTLELSYRIETFCGRSMKT